MLPIRPTINEMHTAIALNRKGKTVKTVYVLPVYKLSYRKFVGYNSTVAEFKTVTPKPAQRNMINKYIPNAGT